MDRSKPEACRKCGGKGTVKSKDSQTTMRCAHCRGTGQVKSLTK